MGTFGARFGRLVAQRRGDLGITQDQLAAEVGTSKPEVSRFENGNVANPRPATIRKYCTALGITEAEVEALRHQPAEATSRLSWELDQLRAEYGTLQEALRHLQDHSRGQLEALATRFRIEDIPDLSDSALFKELKDRAEDFFRNQSPAPASAPAQLRPLIDALARAEADLDFPAAEALHAQITAIRSEIAAEALARLSAARETAEETVGEAAKALEDRARNALNMHDAQAAFAHFTAAAESFRALDPLEPARRWLGYAEPLWQHGLRYGGVGLALAERMIRAALTDLAIDGEPDLWARAQNNLAATMQDQSRRTEGATGTDLMAQAVAAYDAALQVYTRQDHPVDWATTMQNKANALQTQSSRTAGAAGTDLLAQAVDCYDAALQVRTRQDHPVQWATTMQNKAIVLQTQGRRTEGPAGTDLLAEAVECYDAALQVLTWQDHPALWAGTMQNKAGALQTQGARTEGTAGTDLLAQAVACYDAALHVRTRQDHPVQWAMTMQNKASALAIQARGTEDGAGTDLLAQAVACCDAALQVRTRQDHPVHWATTMQNKANALGDLGKRTEGVAGIAQMTQAVNDYEMTLLVLSRSDQPVQWAMTRENMAFTELDTARHPACADPAPHLRAALDHVEAALTVFDPDHMSYNHAKATRLRERILAALEALPPST